MRTLLLLFTILTFAACENDGDFLPPEEATGGGGETSGELPGTWRLNDANTSQETTTTVGGVEVTAVQAGVLIDSLSNYGWTIGENPNTILPSGSLVIRQTTTSNGLSTEVDIEADPVLSVITTYERDGGQLKVNNLAGETVGATIMTLNDSVFNLNVAYDVELEVGGVISQAKVNNTYFFVR